MPSYGPFDSKFCPFSSIFTDYWKLWAHKMVKYGKKWQKMLKGHCIVGFPLFLPALLWFASFIDSTTMISHILYFFVTPWRKIFICWKISQIVWVRKVSCVWSMYLMKGSKPHGKIFIGHLEKDKMAIFTLRYAVTENSHQVTPYNFSQKPVTRSVFFSIWFDNTKDKALGNPNKA